MPKFLAVTSKGLLPVLEEELQQHDFKAEKAKGPACSFEGSWREAYRAHLYLGTAVRILLPVLDFVAYTPEELYNRIREHDFTKYISLEQTFKVEVSLIPSQSWRDGRYVAMKVKDALADMFFDKFGSRPDVAKQDYDLWCSGA